MGKVQSDTTCTSCFLTVLYPYYDPVQHNGDVSPERSSISSIIIQYYTGWAKNRYTILYTVYLLLAHFVIYYIIQYHINCIIYYFSWLNFIILVTYSQFKILSLWHIDWVFMIYWLLTVIYTFYCHAICKHLRSHNVHIYWMYLQYGLWIGLMMAQWAETCCQIYRSIINYLLCSDWIE